MASTEEILAAARKLGEMIAAHKTTRKMEETLQKLQADTEAQRVLNDYNRHATTLAEKQQQGKPIEVEDKRKLEDLQSKVIMNPLLSQFQMVQMDYVDLMRRVDEAMQGQTPDSPGAPGTPGVPGPAPSPLITG